MRPAFLLGEMLLEQLCWVLSLLQEKLKGLSCVGIVLWATDSAFTLNAQLRTKLAHQAHAHTPFSVDARLDLGASSAMTQERNTFRNDVLLLLVFIMGFLQTPMELQDSQRKGLLWGKAWFWAWTEENQTEDRKFWVAVDWDELRDGGMTACIYHFFLLKEGDSYTWVPTQPQILACCYICII